MAAITPQRANFGFKVIRTGTAQANTGQTDWFWVPKYNADFITVKLNVTASAGTTPLASINLRSAPLAIPADDANNIILYTQTPTATPALLQVEGGPGVTGITDDVTATGAWNGVLPDLLGIQALFDRGTADETYTYTLSVSFRA